MRPLDDHADQRQSHTSTSATRSNKSARRIRRGKHQCCCASSRLRQLAEFRNLHAGADMYVVASVASMNHVDPTFFEDRVAIGVNQVYRRFTGLRYVVRKKAHGLEQAIRSAPDSIHFVSKAKDGGRGNANHQLVERVFPNAQNVVVYHVPMHRTWLYTMHRTWLYIDHVPGVASRNYNLAYPADGLIVSGSTITSAIHLAAFMGAATIFLAGHDCDTLDGAMHFDGYHTAFSAKGSPVTNTPAKYRAWMLNATEHGIQSTSIQLNHLLLREYGVRVHSLNPFINHVSALQRGRMVSMELVHAETYRETQTAIKNCPVVAYSTIAMMGEIPLVRPPPFPEKCAFLFVSEKSVVNPSINMTAIVHRRTRDTLSMSDRKFSKIPKLVPHLLFGNRTTVFFDSKLHMKASMTALVDLSRDGFLAAFTHPKCLAGCSPLTWMQTEAKFLMNSGRVGRRDLLAAQVKRYSHAMAPHARCQMYIDGALLIQRNARAVFDPWSREFFKSQNSDRDQIAFAYIAATTCPNVVQLSPRRPCTNNLCHWYVNRTVAALRRHNFEKRAPLSTDRKRPKAKSTPKGPSTL